MKPSTIDEAKRAGWVELTPNQVDAFIAIHPDDLRRDFAAAVDCNTAQEGTPCGGFGGALAASIACFCENGLCKCFAAAGFAVPPP
mgnify:CR=1 FL=1